MPPHSAWQRTNFTTSGRLSQLHMLFARNSRNAHISEMSKRISKSTKRWRVSRIRGVKNEVVGVVVAPDRDAAIVAAIEKQRRLVVWPEN